MIALVFLVNAFSRKWGSKPRVFLSISTNFVSIGYNWRMSSITAALAISQLKKLNKLIKLRRNNAKYLSSNLKKFPEITVPVEPKGYYHVFQLYSIVLKNNKLRNNLKNFLTQKIVQD